MIELSVLFPFNNISIPLYLPSQVQSAEMREDASAVAPQPPPSRQQGRNKKRRAAAPLSADEAAAFVRARAAANGPERVNLKGRELAGPSSVRAVCDAILSFSPSASSGHASTTATDTVVTTTLNLVSEALSVSVSLSLYLSLRPKRVYATHL